MKRRQYRLTIEELIDLELQIHADHDRDPQQLRQRDGSIGREIDARNLAGNSLFLAWLGQLRLMNVSPAASAAGQQTRQWLGLLGLLLFLFGAVLGAGSVSTWLRIDPTEPVNGILFWLVMIGLQLLLLVGWLVAVLPGRVINRLPLLGGVQLFVRLVGRLMPLLLGWLAARISSEHREVLGRLRGAATRFDWLYGPIRFWLLVQLSQIFALAYNLGAVVAFVLLTHGNDPAFCWKSTMLDADQVARATQAVAWPWSVFAENATLDKADIEATRYWSFEQSYLDASEVDNKRAWRKWSMFLLASLLTYGLMPRVVTLIVASWRLRRSITRIKLDHVGFRRLAERLRRDVIETRSPQQDDDENGDAPDDFSPSELIVSDGPASAIKSAGVKLSDQEITDWIRSRFGKTLTSVHRVMGTDDSQETDQLEALLRDQMPEEVFVILEAWEPPVREYLDLLASLRKTLGERKMINVMLYNRAADGRVIQPKQRHSEMWRQKLAAVGDPWLRLEPLCEETVA